MGRCREETRPTRFLHKRGYVFQYVRRVPKDISDLDYRSPAIRHSLKTSDIAKAMMLRDMCERADNELWSALISGVDAKDAYAAHSIGMSKIIALGYSYRSVSDMMNSGSTVVVVERK